MAGLSGENRRRALDRFRAAPVARLATTRADGRPHVVPITFAIDGMAVVTAVDHKPKRHTRLQRLANIEATGFAAVLVDHWDESWDRLWWVRIDGPAAVTATDPSATAALEAKYQQYTEAPPRGPIVRITIATVTAWGLPG